MFAALVELHAVVASWYDPGDNGFDVSDALDVALVIGAIYAGLRVLIALVRWFDARRDHAHRVDIEGIMQPHLDAIRDQIELLTLPIQPQSNGGLSMTDLHTKVDEAIALGWDNKLTIEQVAKRLTGVENEQAASAGRQADASAERSDILDAVKPPTTE